MKGKVFVRFNKDFGDSIKEGQEIWLKENELEMYTSRGIVTVIQQRSMHEVSQFYKKCLENVEEFFVKMMVDQAYEDSFNKKLENVEKTDDALIEVIKEHFGEFANEIIKTSMEETQKKAFDKKPKKRKENALLQIDDYLGNVQSFFEINPFFYDKAGLFWAWDEHNNCWEMIDEVDILNLIEDKLTLFGATIKSSVKTNYLEAFKRVGRMEMPKDAPVTWIQFKDIIYDISNGEKIKASPEYFLTNPIPWKCDFNGECKKLNECFESWVGKENVSLLKEIIAFCMIPKYFLNRIFCFLGSGRNGKSTFMDVVINTLGQNNCTSTDLDDLMNNRFESAKMYKKSACMMGETNFNTMSRTSKLKKLCGGDNVSFEFKNKTPFDGKNYAKLLISTNGLPQTTDKTEGFYRRWVLIDFPNKFSEKKDILATIPDEEYEALCGECIKIAEKLWVNREFTNEGTVEERAKRYEAYSNPLQKFLETHCEENPDRYVFKHEFRSIFEAFCKQNGYRVWNDHEIGKWMKDNDFKTKKVLHKGGFNEPDKWWNAYIGMSLLKKPNVPKNTDLNSGSTAPTSSTSTTSTYSILVARKEETKYNKVEKVEVVEVGPERGEFDNEKYDYHHKCGLCGKKNEKTRMNKYNCPVCKECDDLKIVTEEKI